MSTNALISVVNTTDGSVRTVYLHRDGDDAIRTLVEHYNTQELAEAVVALGHISSLRSTLDCPKGHSFNQPHDYCTIAYHRDRGDELEIMYDIQLSHVDSYQWYHWVFVNNKWECYAIANIA